MFANSSQQVSCFDDAELKDTQGLRAAVDTIHDFRCTLGSILTSWNTFKKRHLHWFEAENNQPLNHAFKESLDAIDDSMAELLSYHERLIDRYAKFDGMLTRVGTPTQMHSLISNCVI